MTRPRVLVTGASGQIGRHVSAPLQALGFDVIAASRETGWDMLADPVGTVERAAARHLIHLDWHEAARFGMNTTANSDWAGATLRLLRAFAERGGKRAVLVGSWAEYDTSAGRLSEATPVRPATFYGAAKAATGREAAAIARGHHLSLAWARPFFSYGPGAPPGDPVGDAVSALLAGEVVDLGAGTAQRDFLYAADTARALAELLASPVEGPVNIGSGQAIAIPDVIRALAGEMGLDRLLGIGSGKPDAQPLIEADITRLRDEVGFRPAYDLASGVRAFVAAAGLTLPADQPRRCAKS